MVSVRAIATLVVAFGRFVDLEIQNNINKL